jgi:DNA adenine methylase
MSAFLRSNIDKKWIVTYDDVPEIRSMYDWLPATEMTLHYSAGAASVGREVMYLSPAIDGMSDGNAKRSVASPGTPLATLPLPP